MMTPVIQCCVFNLSRTWVCQVDAFSSMSSVTFFQPLQTFYFYSSHVFLRFLFFFSTFLHLCPTHSVQVLQDFIIPDAQNTVAAAVASRERLKACRNTSLLDEKGLEKLRRVDKDMHIRVCRRLC